MTVDSALRKLTPPLIFGNEAQIKAANFLSQVEEAIEAIRACQHEPRECVECNGNGTVLCPCCGEGQCEGCGGIGFNPESTCDRCCGTFSSAVIMAALQAIEAINR